MHQNLESDANLPPRHDLGQDYSRRNAGSRRARKPVKSVKFGGHPSKPESAHVESEKLDTESIETPTGKIQILLFFIRCFKLFLAVIEILAFR